MKKADVIQQVAHAFVPEGTRMISRDINENMRATRLTPGSALLMGAGMLAEMLEEKLSDVPDDMTFEHADRIAEEVRAFFAGTLEATQISSVQKMIEGQQTACLNKIQSLFRP